jgi:hypothetical protein
MAKSKLATAVLEREQLSPLVTPTDLKGDATKDISGAMNAILADVFALYLKTKNFHWHMSGPHFRDYHLLLDEQADQIFAIPLRSAFGRWAARRCARSGISPVCNAWTTMTPPMLNLRTCLPNCAKTTRRSQPVCGKLTASATNTKTSPRPV